MISVRAASLEAPKLEICVQRTDLFVGRISY